MFIDIHVHTRTGEIPPRRGKPAYATPEQLLERYDKIGVEQAVLLPGVGTECAYAPQSNQEVLEICRRHPGRFIPFCNVDPRSMTNSEDAPLGELLEFYRERGCKGIGEITANLPLLDARVQNLFRHAERAALPLTFHMGAQIGGLYGLYDDPGLPQLDYSLGRFPNLIFLGHSQTFWAEIGRLEKPAIPTCTAIFPPEAATTRSSVIRSMPCDSSTSSRTACCSARISAPPTPPRRWWIFSWTSVRAAESARRSFKKWPGRMPGACWNSNGFAARHSSGIRLRERGRLDRQWRSRALQLVIPPHLRTALCRRLSRHPYENECGMILSTGARSCD